ncbi:MAG: hypothetical protein HQM04_09125 [Magnetococcales bacterium]|nr:hypothetical protein [Magnetococcales bacterium]MBF0115193.1 hypothetical protein [Magnetococcales bacterium]
MAVQFSDQQIADLLKENKPLPDDYLKRIVLRSKPGHKLRLGIFNILDFSIILTVVTAGSSCHLVP